MNRYSRLAKSPDREPSFSIYHKDGWYTTNSFYICKRSYRSGAKTRSFDKWQLDKSRIKDCRFDRIGRPLEKPACESHQNFAEYNDLLCRFHGKYALQKLTRAYQSSVMLFVSGNLLGMGVGSICEKDGSCRTREQRWAQLVFSKGHGLDEELSPKSNRCKYPLIRTFITAH